jgi:hypothetical protein
MHIEYVHASKFGNGAAIARELAATMADRGIEVVVHHVDDLKRRELSPADLYVFSSPGRMGKPIRGMRRFLHDLRLPAGARYALLTTEMAPQPDKRTGRMPTEEETGRYQRVRPIMHELLRAKGLVPVAEETVYVTGIKGPLEDEWRTKVRAFAARILEAVEAVRP